MIRNAGRAAREEISAARLVASVVVLAAGALVLDLVPLMGAIARLGYGWTAVLVLGIVALSLVFWAAYERFTPASPPTPRRDLVVILFAALLIGMWSFLVTSVLIAFLLLGGVGAYVLMPDRWRQGLRDRLPW